MSKFDKSYTYFSAEIKFLSIPLMFCKKFLKNKDKICPWPSV